MKIFRQPSASELSNDEFVRLLTTEYTAWPGPERRQLPREETPPIPVEVQPLNDAFQPIGPSFYAVVRNISESGLGLMYCDDVCCRFAEVQAVLPSGAILRTVLEIKHCIGAGVMLGGEFVAKCPPTLL